MTKRVFISISGGCLDEVFIPPVVDGTWCLIDWDNIDSDPEREWKRFDEHDREYLKENYPEAFEQHFAKFA